MGIGDKVCYLVLHTLFIVSHSNPIEELLKSRKTIPPGTNGGALEVFLGIYIESIGNFRSQEMSFDVDLYIYTSWRDPNLTHSGEEELQLVNDPDTREKMWLPDLYFANARKCSFQEVTVPNFNLFISRNGTVSYSLRATCTISCSLNLANFPMDKQICYIRIVSYAHVSDLLKVQWFSDEAIRHNREIGLPEFRIKKIRKDYCLGLYRYALTEFSHREGNFSCLKAEFHLSRSIGYNLVQSYIPSGLIVMISWVSFFIDRKDAAVPARVTLSFTTLLSLTTLGNGLRYDLPQVSYTKAIDLWYGGCLAFVFAALVEFAVINSFMRKSEKYNLIANREGSRRGRPGLRRNRSEANRYPGLNTTVRFNSSDKLKNVFEHESLLNKEGSLRGNGLDKSNPKGSLWRNLREKMCACGNGRNDREEPVYCYDSDDMEQPSFQQLSYFRQISIDASRQALHIDKMSRVGFPLAFLIFNVLYWSYFYEA